MKITPGLIQPLECKTFYSNESLSLTIIHETSSLFEKSIISQLDSRFSIIIDTYQNNQDPSATSEPSEEVSVSSRYSQEATDEVDEMEEEKCYYDQNDDASFDNESHTASLNSNYEDLLALNEGLIKKGLLEAEIKRFPTYTYLSSNQSANPDSCCVICISSFEVGQIVREIVCGHEFHKECIDKWLNANIKCPICNKYLR